MVHDKSVIVNYLLYHHNSSYLYFHNKQGGVSIPNDIVVRNNTQSSEMDDTFIHMPFKNYKCTSCSPWTCILLTCNIYLTNITLVLLMKIIVSR